MPALVMSDLEAMTTTPDGAESEAELISACRAGDRNAFRRFVGRYERLVFAYLSRAVGRGAHVEDLAQEVFLRAYRALPNFDVRGPARASTWLLTIARRLACDARRRRHVHLQLCEDDHLQQLPATPETEGQRLQLGRALARAAATLPEDQLDAFILAEFHGMQMAELAEAAADAGARKVIIPPCFCQHGDALCTCLP